MNISRQPDPRGGFETASIRSNGGLANFLKARCKFDMLLSTKNHRPQTTSPPIELYDKRLLLAYGRELLQAFRYRDRRIHPPDQLKLRIGTAPQRRMDYLDASNKSKICMQFGSISGPLHFRVNLFALWRVYRNKNLKQSVWSKIESEGRWRTLRAQATKHRQFKADRLSCFSI